MRSLDVLNWNVTSRENSTFLVFCTSFVIQNCFNAVFMAALQ